MSQILIVDAPALADAVAMFPTLNPMVVNHESWDTAPIAGQGVIIWAHYSTFIAEQANGVASEVGIVNGDKTPRSFGQNARQAMAYMRQNIKRWTPPPTTGSKANREPQGDDLIRESVANMGPSVRGVPAASGTVVELRHKRQEKPEPDDAVFCEFAEDAVAQRFTQRHPEWRYVAKRGQWMQWTGESWKEDSTLQIYDLARALCRDVAQQSENASPSSLRKLRSAGMRAAVENLARSDRAHATSIDIWDADTMTLATPGGVIDLRDGSMRPARMDDYCLKLTNATPNGECPRWLEFLKQTTDGDIELQTYLQRLCGYALTGDTREHSLTFIYGTGGNGKGTFLDTIQRIMGTYACNASMDVFTEQRGERHSTEVARLAGARLVVAQETEQGKRWAEARVKALTGGDTMTARFMRQDDFEFKPQLKLVIAGNHKPSLRNVDEAMRRRLHLIPFMRKPNVVNKDLRDQLWEERNGILAWCVDGCLNWQARGLDAPESVRVATEDYFADQDMIAQWIAEKCETGSSFTVKIRDLYTSYRTWCESLHEPAMRQGELKDALFSRGFDTRGTKAHPLIGGIHLQTAQEPAQQSRFTD
jgi:putative DNA primase/helicase